MPRIVGVPLAIVQRNGTMLHYFLGNGDFRVFADMFARLTVAQTMLDNAGEACGEIQWILQECWNQSRTVYIQLPTDMVLQQVGISRLKEPLDLKYPRNDPSVEVVVIKKILARLYSAKKPLITVDGCAIRHKVSNRFYHFHVLLTRLNFSQKSTASCASQRFQFLLLGWAETV